MIGKTASEISRLVPPGRNEKGEYFDIWWASLNLIWEREEKWPSYDSWILKEYLPSKDTVWENPDSFISKVDKILRMLRNESPPRVMR